MSLTLDYTHCLSEAIGATHGLTKSEVDTLVAKFPKHHENIEELRTAGESGFFELPYQDIADLKALIKKHQGKWENLVVVAIGGAVMGLRSLLGSLAHAQYNHLDAKGRRNGPRIFVLSPDPVVATQLLDSLDAKKTLVHVISRSGLTVEVQLMTSLVLEWLRKKSGKTAPAAQMVISTDPAKSPLMEVAKAEKCDVLPMAANLAGRFAVLGSPCLFGAALAGIDIDAIRAGGAEMDKRCRHGDPNRNPAYMHSLIHYLLTRKRRKTMHATFAFSERLRGPVDWYGHLLSVSLGKMLNRKGKAVHVGPSPVNAVGSFDIHGQQQLFSEGPFDKVVTFLTVKDHGPKVAAAPLSTKVETLSFVKDADFAGVLDKSFVTAENHVVAAGRPAMTILLDRIDEATIGGLHFMLELSTAMSAELYGIDPFDQPGVDHGKHGVFAQFGRAGFEDLAKKLADHRAKPRRTC
jgi:glucose-6-phosphate isomerase